MRYGIIGFSGRMGHEIDELFREKGHECVLLIDDKTEKVESVPEVILDFSLPSGIEKTINNVRKYQCALITGVTGYSAEQLEAIRALGQEVPVVQSFNFSLGIQLMLKMVNLLKEPLKDWDVEIAETHHRFKKDKPSGTAKMLAATIGREVPTSSFRLGNVLGDHSIAFGSLGEIITLSHRTLSRRAFAEGALLSADLRFARNQVISHLPTFCLRIDAKSAGFQLNFIKQKIVNRKTFLRKISNHEEYAICGIAVSEIALREHT